jgi:penicillin-binding protein 2
MPTGRAPAKVIRVISVGIFMILVAALFRLQIVRSDHYVQLSENNYIVEASINAPRGCVTDRNGEIIAGCRQSFSIYAIPRTLLRNQGEIRILARILGVDEELIVSRLEKTASTYRPTAVMRDVDFATLSRVEEMFAELPDVIVASVPVRTYPFGEEFAHVLGYVGEVTQAEIASDPTVYVPGDFIGKSGIEKSYETYLRGKDGKKYVKFTPHGGAGPIDLEDLPVRLPRSGMTVVLSADSRLQTLAHQELLGRRGCVIAVDVKTGGVLALVSSPYFDPNLFATGISSADWEDIIGAPGKPLLNRAIQSTYPPGSIYKLVTSAVGLETGKISRNTRFQTCRGAYRFGNRTFSCWKKEGHGVTNLIDAVAVSCDVYFYQLGERLSLDSFSGYAKGWVIDKESGVDLPGEVSGLIPTSGYYDRVYGAGKWTRGLMLNLAIGQGELLLTPMQVVCFICGIAGSGEYVTPHCVERVETDRRVENIECKRVRLDMDAKTLEALGAAMLHVVEDSDGTGRAAKLPGIKVAGKTGTAQNPHGEDHASFVCFAPYEDPEIVVFVLIENGGHGSVVAAPVAQRILASYFGVPLGDEIVRTP